MNETNIFVLDSCNEDTVTIVDVTDKTRPVQLSRTSYHGVAYTHQGWLTEDHNTFLFGDELDERSSKIKKTTSYVMRVADLENPVIVGSRSAMTSEAVDHNMYTKFGCVYQSNYKAGLRVLEIGDVANSADLTEAAFFDVYPESDSGGFGGGSWSNYPYFPSGNVVVSSIDRGLFVVKVDVDENSFVSTPSPIDECLDESNRCSSFFGWKKGFYMHRAALGGRLCWRRCVVGPQVARSERSGWMCGKSCYDEQSF